MALNTREHMIEAYQDSIKTVCSMIVILLICALIPVPASAAEIPFNTSIGGDRNLGQEYTWTVSNASGYAGATYHYAVFDFKEIGQNYTYHSPSWGQWFMKPADPGKKFVAVWVRGWLDGTAWYGYDQDRFSMWVYGNTTISPEAVHLQDLEIGHKGSDRWRPAIIQNLENLSATNERGVLTTGRYGWKDENEMDRLEPGRSNALEGYIIYQVPVSSTANDYRVAGWFGFWGTAVWHITNVTIDQDSIEKQIAENKRLMDIQRQAGVRIFERDANRKIV